MEKTNVLSITLVKTETMRKRIYTCMCDWVTVLYSRKLAEPCKPTTIEKIKIT